MKVLRAISGPAGSVSVTYDIVNADHDGNPDFVVPEGSESEEAFEIWLEKMFPGRWIHKPGYCHRVVVYNARVLECPTLTELAIELHAGSVVFVRDISSVRADLQKDGFGTWNYNSRLNCFFNGLVVDTHHGVCECKMDPKRASAVLKARRKRGDAKPRKQTPKLRAGVLNGLGQTLTMELVDRLKLSDFRSVCMTRGAYISFQGAGWADTIYSLWTVIRLLKHNKLHAKPEVRRWLKAHKGVLELIAKHIKMLAKREAKAAKADDQDTQNEDSNSKRLSKILRWIIRQKGK